jgi:diguanylate cyclase (GGDEF)-like protein
LLLLAGAIYTLVQLRTRWLRLRQQQLEHKVQQRTAELEAMSQALQRKSAELEAATLTDPLTGLRNRRFLVEQVERDLAQSARRHEDHLRHGMPLGERSDLIVFMIDIDHFKQVNDDHGHAAGDAVLVQMCARLRLVFRDSDYLVRWGGEEFLIVALGTSRAHAAELAERARAVVAAEPFQLDGGTTVHKTCSIGFVCYPPVPALPRLFDWNTVVNIADAALYAVKASGRDGWLGVLQAQGDSPDDLRRWSREPLRAWHAAGGLRMAASNGVKSSWLDSARKPPPDPPQPASVLPPAAPNRPAD